MSLSNNYQEIKQARAYKENIKKEATQLSEQEILAIDFIYPNAHPERKKMINALIQGNVAHQHLRMLQKQLVLQKEQLSLLIKKIAAKLAHSHAHEQSQESGIISDQSNGIEEEGVASVQAALTKLTVLQNEMLETQTTINRLEKEIIDVQEKRIDLIKTHEEVAKKTHQEYIHDVHQRLVAEISEKQLDTDAPAPTVALEDVLGWDKDTDLQNTPLSTIPTPQLKVLKNTVLNQEEKELEEEQQHELLKQKIPTTVKIIVHIEIAQLISLTGLSALLALEQRYTTKQADQMNTLLSNLDENTNLANLLSKALTNTRQKWQEQQRQMNDLLNFIDDHSCTHAMRPGKF